MKKFSLTRVGKLTIGERFIAAASGLILISDNIFVIADDQLSLGIFPLDLKNPGQFYPLFPTQDHPLKHLPKKNKADFESLVAFNGGLLVLPSGSRPNRMTGAFVTLGNENNILKSEKFDLTPLYQELLKTFPELNIEGAVAFGSGLKLFQRGNGESKSNAIITVDQDLKVKNIKTINLGDIDGVSLGFSDASLSETGKEIYFLAVAENTSSTYADGKIMGSVIGKLIQDDEIEILGRLDFPSKPEGLAMTSESFLVVTDDDDKESPASLYKIQRP